MTEERVVDSEKGASLLKVLAILAESVVCLSFLTSTSLNASLCGTFNHKCVSRFREESYKHTKILDYALTFSL